jgi:HlyD family secretion protein
MTAMPRPASTRRPVDPGLPGRSTTVPGNQDPGRIACPGSGDAPRKFSASLVGFSLVLALLPLGCGPSGEGQGGRSASASSRAEVTVTPIALRPMDQTITVLGTLQAMDRATISVQVGGRLQTLGVDVGRKVMSGEVLAQVEPREFELRLQQAEALLGQSRARLGLPLEGDDDDIDPEQTSIFRESKARFDEARKNLERVLALQGERLVPESEVERAEAAFEVASTRLAESMQEIRERQAILIQRRAEFHIARQRLVEASVRAPFDGVVQSRLVNAGDFLNPGTPVVELVRVNPLRLLLDIPERQSHLIQQDQPVIMTLEGDPEAYMGTLARLSPALDPRTRMLRVEAEFQNPGHLRPGAFVKATITVRKAVPTLAVPKDAIVTFAGAEKAFVVVTNTALEKQITTGRVQGDWVEVRTGLSEGDAVVRRPGGLRSGTPVQASSTLTSNGTKDAGADAEAPMIPGTASIGSTVRAATP